MILAALASNIAGAACELLVHLRYLGMDYIIWMIQLRLVFI